MVRRRQVSATNAGYEGECRPTEGPGALYGAKREHILKVAGPVLQRDGLSRTTIRAYRGITRTALAAVTGAASAEAIADLNYTQHQPRQRPSTRCGGRIASNHGGRLPRRAGFPSKGRCRKLLQSDPAGRAWEADQEQRAANLRVEFGRPTGFDPQAGKGTELRIVV